MAALAAHQVIIVCGETGSGKTTQLPKIALSLGRGKLHAAPGQKGQLIGHVGSANGVAVGQSVRVAAGLVGRTVEVGTSATRVLLLEASPRVGGRTLTVGGEDLVIAST